MNTRLFVTFIFVFIMGFSACKKNNDSPTIALTTSLNIVNASADTVNFYLNGTRLNQNSNLYPTGSSGYILVTFGTQNYQVKKMFNPVTSIVKPLFTKSLTLDTGRAYSFFIAGETASDAFATTDVLLQPDTLATQSFIRFVNASPDAGTFDVTINDTLRFKNQVFQSSSDFTPIGIGTKSIKLFHTGSATAVDSLSLSMSSESIFTVYVKGKAAGTGNSALGFVSMSNR